MSAADLGGPEGASLAAQDFNRETSRAVDLGEQERSLGAGLRRSSIFGPTVPRIHGRIEINRNIASNHRPSLPLDKQNKVPGLPAFQKPSQGYNNGGSEAVLAGTGNRQLPFDQDIKSLDSYSSPLYSPRDPSSGGNQDAKNVGPLVDLSEPLGINPLNGKMSKGRGCKTPAQGQDVNGNVFSTVQHPAGINPLYAPANNEDIKGPQAQDKIRPKDGFQTYDPVIPGESRTQNLGITLTGEEQQVKGSTQEDARHLSEAQHVNKKSKPLRMPGQTERNTQAASKRKALSF